MFSPQGRPSLAQSDGFLPRIGNLRVERFQTSVLGAEQLAFEWGSLLKTIFDSPLSISLFLGHPGNSLVGLLERSVKREDYLKIAK
jgi:hypothetical protein